MSKPNITRAAPVKAKLQLDKRYESSVARLQAMGLKFYTEIIGDDECYIAIDMESVVRLIDSKITYPSRETFLDGRTMVIHFWRGVVRTVSPKP